MLNVISCKGDAGQNHKEVSLFPRERGWNTSRDEDGGLRHCGGGREQGHCFGKAQGGSGDESILLHVTPGPHPWAHTQEK